MFTRQCNEVFK